MRRIVPIVYILLTLCFFAMEVNPMVTPTKPLPPNFNNARRKNVIAFRYHVAERDGTEDSSSSNGSIVYKVTIGTLVGLGLLIALGFLIKNRLKKMKQTSMQEECTMTCHDTRLSSQFLSDLSEAERKKKTSISPQNTKEKPIILDIIAATPPIPSNISLTSPMGKTKTWKRDSDFVSVDVSEREIPSRVSSLPSLSSDPSSSSPESRESSRRDAVLLHSDDEDLLADLKKKRRKHKKAWKKIIKTG